jgi:hypothetical protein
MIQNKHTYMFKFVWVQQKARFIAILSPMARIQSTKPLSNIHFFTFVHSLKFMHFHFHDCVFMSLTTSYEVIQLGIIFIFLSLSTTSSHVQSFCKIETLSKLSNSVTMVIRIFCLSFIVHVYHYPIKYWKITHNTVKPPFKVCLGDKLFVPWMGVNLNWGFGKKVPKMNVKFS